MDVRGPQQKLLGSNLGHRLECIGSNLGTTSPACCVGRGQQHRTAGFNWTSLGGVIIVLFFSQLNSAVMAWDDLDRVSVVFSAEFQRNQDKNADRQPDGWTRRKDRDHPSFIRSGINARDPDAAKKAKETELTLAKLHNAWTTKNWNPNYVPEVVPPNLAALVDKTILNDCYEVRMDGGAFELASPRFDLDTRYDYILQGDLDCRDLNSHKAQIELRIYHRNGNLLNTYAVPSVSQTQAWQVSKSDIISIPGDGIVRGEIVLSVTQARPQFGRGVARFDNIQLQRMPTLTIKSTATNNISAPGVAVDFACFAAGLSAETKTIQLEISDIDGASLRRDSKPLSRQEEATIPSGRFTSTTKLKNSSKSEKSFAIFSHTFEHPGLYQVQAKVGNSQRQVMIAVLDTEAVEKSPFGISLPTLTKYKDVADLLSLAQSTQLGWMKVPIWFDEHDTNSSKATLSLLKGLRSQGIKTIGVLDEPPSSQFILFEEDPSRVQAISHLQNKKIWEPLLDPILTQLNSHLDYVQLGDDKDTSFMFARKATAIIDEVRTVFQYYFQDPKLVISWDWLTPSDVDPDNETSTAISAIQFGTHTPLSAAELNSYAQAQSKQRVKTWVSIDPLPESGYSLHDRVEDLMEKMINVKLTGVQAAFLTKPFDSETGILDELHLPTEILVPWAHVAAAVGPRSSIGSVELPAGSRNITFKGQSRDVMILWNPRPVVEQFYFGEKIAVIDVWGREIPVSQVKQSSGSIVQSIPVGKWPLLIYGVDSDVIKWRQEFQLLVDHLASHLSSENNLALRLQNTFNRRAKGSLTLQCDSLLKGGQSVHPIDIEAGRNEKLSIPLELRSDASAGAHKIEFRFKLQTDREHDFTLTRTLNLGHPDIEFRWELVRLNADSVEARVELINKTSRPIDFDCTLFPPDLPYLRIPMSNLSPGTNSLRQRLAIAENDNESKSQIWIRCEQVRSPLTLNYLVTVKRPEEQ